MKDVTIYRPTADRLTIGALYQFSNDIEQWRDFDVYTLGHVTEGADTPYSADNSAGYRFIRPIPENLIGKINAPKLVNGCLYRFDYTNVDNVTHKDFHAIAISSTQLECFDGEEFHSEDSGISNLVLMVPAQA